MPWGEPRPSDGRASRYGQAWEALALCGGSEAFVEANEGQSHRPSLRGGKARRKLQGVGGPQVVNAEEPAGIVAQQVGRLYLLPGRCEAIEASTRRGR
jgi:hypothetical protein